MNRIFTIIDKMNKQIKSVNNIPKMNSKYIMDQINSNTIKISKKTLLTI